MMLVHIFIVVAHFGDPLRGFDVRVSDQIGDDVGVQHVAGQSTRSGAGTGSSISGKLSSIGFIVWSKATRRPQPPQKKAPRPQQARGKAAKI
jgi:hypothetical protein